MGVMTLDEAISLAESIGFKNGPTAENHIQLAAWLKELQYLRFWRDHAAHMLRSDVEWSFPLEIEDTHINACPTCFSTEDLGHEKDCALGVLLLDGGEDDKEK